MDIRTLAPLIAVLAPLFGCVGEPGDLWSPPEKIATCVAEYKTLNISWEKVDERGTQWLNSDGNIVEAITTTGRGKHATSSRSAKVWSGDLLLEHHRDYEDDGEFDFRTEWVYDGQGREIERTTWEHDTQLWTNVSIYDADGQLSLIEYYDKGVLQRWTAYKFLDGRKVRTEYHHSDGELTDIVEYTYQYPAPSLNHTVRAVYPELSDSFSILAFSSKGELLTEVSFSEHMTTIGSNTWDDEGRQTRREDRLHVETLDGLIWWGVSTTWTFDDDGRLESSATFTEGVQDTQTDWTYDCVE